MNLHNEDLNWEDSLLFFSCELCFTNCGPNSASKSKLEFSWIALNLVCHTTGDKGEQISLWPGPGLFLYLGFSECSCNVRLIISSCISPHICFLAKDDFFAWLILRPSVCFLNSNLVKKIFALLCMQLAHIVMRQSLSPFFKKRKKKVNPASLKIVFSFSNSAYWLNI